MILMYRKLDKPHIFKMGSILVAVEEFDYCEHGKRFTPIASAFTLEELYEELKPSLFTRIKKWIGFLNMGYTNLEKLVIKTFEKYGIQPRMEGNYVTSYDLGSLIVIAHGEDLVEVHAPDRRLGKIRTDVWASIRPAKLEQSVEDYIIRLLRNIEE